jgi:phosphoribosylanthranilate isomerase
MKVKICGITNKDDATWALNYGADFIGVNFWKGSTRHITAANAIGWVPTLPPFAGVVGVFVDEDPGEVATLAAKLNLKAVQLHGAESPEYVRLLKKALEATEEPPKIIKTIRVKNEDSIRQMEKFAPMVDYFLLDSHVEGEAGGTGVAFDWTLVEEAKKFGKPVFLAGGLTPENVKEAVAKGTPFAVDVASGVEKSAKRKDLDKMRSFITNAKKS